MPKETITLTRDLFDEMLQAAADKERNQILQTLRENLYGEAADLIEQAIQ